MPHRQVDPQVFDEIDKEIENHRKALKEANIYREDKDRDSIKSLLRGLRAMLEVIQKRKDASLLTCTEEGSRYSVFMLGRQKQIQEIIESFEDSEGWETYHKNEILKLEQERETLNKLPPAA